MTLSVLHISDLHRDRANPIGNQVLLDSLERDRQRYTTSEDKQIGTPNLIIVSGDIIQGAKGSAADTESQLRAQYDEALEFLNNLSTTFVDGDKQRVIIVPGNHDVSDYLFRQNLSSIELTDDKKKEAAAGLFEQDSLPIRLTHSPTTCRVLPFP